MIEEWKMRQEFWEEGEECKVQEELQYTARPRVMKVQEIR